MSTISRLMLMLVLVLTIGASAVNLAHCADLEDALIDLGSATIDDVTSEGRLLQGSSRPFASFQTAPAVTPFITVFDGYFAPARSDTKFAVSADGTVSIEVEGRPLSTVYAN